MTETDKQDQAAPPLASLMGFGGLIPFFVCAGAAHSGVAPWNALAVMACGVYGSVILSFVGAVHWGFLWGFCCQAVRSGPGYRWIA